MDKDDFLQVKSGHQLGNIGRRIFQMSDYELEFVERVLKRKPNLQIYRTDKKSCMGDFVINYRLFNAEAGDGGAIFIRTENFLKSSDSKVTATSNRGNDGTVEIEAPDTDVTGALTPMPDTFIDATSLMEKPCSARTAADYGRFYIKPRDAMPTNPEDLQASPPRPFRTINPECKAWPCE